MAEIKIGKKDYIWSYMGTFIKLGVNIILLPIVLVYLTDDELGLWYVFGSISTLVALLDFGFAPSLARNISYVWCGSTKLQKENVSIVGDKGETDFVYFKTVLLTCRAIYLVIALVALAFLLSIGSYYIYKISNLVAVYAWIVYSFATFINLLYGYYGSFLRGVGAVAEYNKSSVYSKLIQVFFSVIFLIAGWGLMGVSIAFLISGISVRFYSYVVFYKYENIGKHLKLAVVDDLKPKIVELFKIVWHNASKEGLVTLSNYLSTQANTLICSFVIGLSSTGSYGLSVQLATIIGSISSVIFSANHPKLQEMSVSNNLEGGKRIFASSMGIYVLTFITLSVLLLLGLPIIVYFKPTYNVNVIMLICILLYMFLYNFYHLFCSYISTFNILPYTKSFILTAILTVLLSYVAAKFFNIGIWALILCPIIVSLSFNVWYWPRYVLHNILHISLYSFVKVGFLEISKIINGLKYKLGWIKK